MSSVKNSKTLGLNQRFLRGFGDFGEGTHDATREVDQMKICDICSGIATLLTSCPIECENLEMCGNCAANILPRFHSVEKRILEVRVQLRLEAIEAWRLDRAPKPPTP